MRLLKKHVLLRFVNSYVVDSPQPANISYLWNFGSLLAVCLILQILTGILLAMHYQPHVDFAFNSVEHMLSSTSKSRLCGPGASSNVFIKSWNMLGTRAQIVNYLDLVLVLAVGQQVPPVPGSRCPAPDPGSK